MKKIVAMILIFTLCTSVPIFSFATVDLSVNTDMVILWRDTALETGPFTTIGVKKYNRQDSKYDEFLNKYKNVTDVQVFIDSFEDVYNTNPENFTSERKQEAYDQVGEIEMEMVREGLFPNTISNQIQSKSSAYDSNKAKLREGNFIEIILDTNEGLTAKQATACVGLSVTAKSQAKKYYSSVNYIDPAQHFIWNFNMTKNYGKSIARRVGNNHEWGITMIPYMENYYNERYNYYLNTRKNASQSASSAYLDTIAYMPEFKYVMVRAMNNSQQFFNNYFSNKDCIMDFWNNCYGRAYPAKGYSSGINAFQASLKAKEIILGPSRQNVTNAHYTKVHDWDWYSY